MSERPIDQLLDSLEEVRDFFAGKGGTIRLTTFDGSGGGMSRDLTLEEYLQAMTANKQEGAADG